MTGMPPSPAGGPNRPWTARVTPERLVVVGSVLADVALKVPALPPPGGDVLASSPRTQAGGGFNVAAAANRLGLPTALVGYVGEGPFGEIAREALRRESVDLLLPAGRGGAGDTGFCVALVEPDGERTFVTSPGIESQLSVHDLASARIEPGDVLWVSGYDLCYPVSGPAIAGWVSSRLPRTAMVVFDPGPLIGDVPQGHLDAVLGRVDVLTLNTREASLLAGLTPPDPGHDGPALDEVGRALLSRLSAHALVLLRQGAHGCTLFSRDHGRLDIPALQDIAVLDTTGAGDAHTGAFVATLTRHDVPTAATLANVAAGISVMREGSATGPTSAELDLALSSQSLVAATLSSGGAGRRREARAADQARATGTRRPASP